MKLRETPDGTAAHFTNHPCRPSVPVTVEHTAEGNVRFADGRRLAAFDDEVTEYPVTGLGQARVQS